MRRHIKSDQSSNEVRAYATVGTPHHDISVLMNLSTKTLLRHYRKELDEGKARGNATVAKTLFTAATVGNNLGAQMFWLRCQAGWREVQVVQNQLLDKDGNAVDQPVLGISFSDGGPGMPLKALTHDHPVAVIEPQETDEDAGQSVTH
jgi:hypothetical protein